MTIDERIEFLMQSIESHDRQIGELTGQLGELKDQIGDLTKAVDKLVNVSNEDATAIRTLARIADAHEKRISRLEENR
jgi:chromosome segregation ATPase